MKEFPQQTYYELTDSELDTLIQQGFNKPDFSSVAAYEWSNDTEHSGTVKAADAAPDSSDYNDIQEFLKMKRTPQYPIHWSTLLGELARRGEIPEGNYLVSICW